MAYPDTLPYVVLRFGTFITSSDQLQKQQQPKSSAGASDANKPTTPQQLKSSSSTNVAPTPPAMEQATAALELAIKSSSCAAAAAAAGGATHANPPWAPGPNDLDTAIFEYQRHVANESIIAVPLASVRSLSDIGHF